MSVRAKFKVDRIENADDGKHIHMSAVVDDSLENKEFFRWTPGGSIVLYCVNEQANRQFVVGHEVYVDFSMAPFSTNAPASAMPLFPNEPVMPP